MPVTLSVVNERFRRIMMMHPEVEALTAAEQARYDKSKSLDFAFILLSINAYNTTQSLWIIKLATNARLIGNFFNFKLLDLSFLLDKNILSLIEK